MEGGSLNLTCQAVSGVRQHRQLNLAQFNSLTSKLVLKAAILLWENHSGELASA